MAKKGQKFNKYTLEFKYKVIKEVHEGKSHTYVSKKYGVPRGTIGTWTRMYNRDGALGIKTRGRPIENEPNYKERYEILKKFQDFLVNNTQNKK